MPYIMTASDPTVAQVDHIYLRSSKNERHDMLGIPESKSAPLFIAVGVSGAVVMELLLCFTLIDSASLSKMNYIIINHLKFKVSTL